VDKYRVIQFGTGQTGTAALQGIIDDPRLELVGLRVYSEKKEGRDAGELAGRPPTGVIGTRDADALIALDADCVCYSATDMFGTDHVIDEISRILASGKSMVGTTITRLVYPDMVPEFKQRIQAACREGGSTFHWDGINPGFALDLVPAMTATGLQAIERIEITEYLDMSLYEDKMVRDGMGFGLSPQQSAQTDEMLTAMFKMWFSPIAYLLASELGVTIDGEEPTLDKALADSSFEVLGSPVEKGTISAVAYRCDYSVNGVPRITVHERFRVAPSFRAPWPAGWPQPPGGLGGYRVTMDARPKTEIEMFFPIVNGSDPLVDALIFTGTRVASLIPAVCRATPGIHSISELGELVFGRVDW
jgi:2,4-diaminopentanoate dehydrogenase